MKQVTVGPGDIGPAYPPERDEPDDEELIQQVWERLLDNPPDWINEEMIEWWIDKHSDDTKLLVKIAYGEQT